MKGKTERNLEIYRLRQSNPKLWSYRKIAERYNLSIERIRQIVNFVGKKEVKNVK